ncbi:MAG: hypothetical protein AB8G05_00905 [Oligoflexales bacterium]
MIYYIIHDNPIRISQWSDLLGEHLAGAYDHPAKFYLAISTNPEKFKGAVFIFDRYWPGKKDLIKTNLFQKIKLIIKRVKGLIVISSMVHQDFDRVNGVDLVLLGKARSHAEMMKAFAKLEYLENKLPCSNL